MTSTSPLARLRSLSSSRAVAMCCGSARSWVCRLVVRCRACVTNRQVTASRSPLEDATLRCHSGCWRLPARVASCTATGRAPVPGWSDDNHFRHQGQSTLGDSICYIEALRCGIARRHWYLSLTPTRGAVAPHSSMTLHQYQQCSQHAVSSPSCPAVTPPDSRILNVPQQCWTNSHSSAGFSHTSPQTHLKLLQSSADTFIKLIAVHFSRHAVPTWLVVVLPHQHLTGSASDSLLC